MKRLLILALLLCPSLAHANISHIAADCTGTSSCTTTGNATGDLEIAFAGRDGSATAPTTATGWTSLGTITINGTGSADSAVRIACKVTTGANEASNTFTNATALMIQVYRGQLAGATAVCASSIIGTPSNFSTAINTTSTTETFNAITTSSPLSWVVGMGYAPAATGGMSTAPSGMTNRTSCASCTSTTSGGGHDTNGEVTSFASANVTITTASRIMTSTMEIKPAPCSNTTYRNWTCVQAQGGNGGGNTTSATAFSSALTNPSIIIVGCDKDGIAFSAVPTDTAGNTYLDAGQGSVAFNGSADVLQLWYALNTSTTASNVVTCHSSDSPSFPSVDAAEFTGNATSSPVDVGAKNANATSGSGSNNMTSTAATTLANGDLIIGWSSAITGPETPGSSPNVFTQILTGFGGEFEWFVQTSAASIAATMTTGAGAGDAYGAIMGTFKVPTVSSTHAPRLPLLGVGP